ncbi:MAG: phosphatase PAP2 family protein [Silvibacterium sp.]|nr:phosphatase PAP2 family protein [Silvibacterium sp.]
MKPAVLHKLPESWSWKSLKRYPELALLCFSLTAVLIGRSLHLPSSPPDMNFGAAALSHYIFPLALAIVVHLRILIRSKSSRRDSVIILGLSIPTLFVVTYCHFQCKVWMPLINPHRFGPVYESVDRLFTPIVGLCGYFVALMDRAGLDVSGAYHGWFILFFFVCFGLHALRDTPTGQRQVILGVGWILALGGVGYWIAPAVGPFIYRNGADSNATLIQNYMWQKFHLLVLTRHIPAGYFLSAPAAMPSLHIAHAAFFVWMLRRMSRGLSLLFLPLLLWFTGTAVGLAWHYILDLPAGFLLAAFVVVLVKKTLPDPEMHESLEPVVADDIAAGELIPA